MVVAGLAPISAKPATTVRIQFQIFWLHIEFSVMICHWIYISDAMIRFWLPLQAVLLFNKVLQFNKIVIA